MVCRKREIQMAISGKRLLRHFPNKSEMGLLLLFSTQLNFWILKNTVDRKREILIARSEKYRSSQRSKEAFTINQGWTFFFSFPHTLLTNLCLGDIIKYNPLNVILHQHYIITMLPKIQKYKHFNKHNICL